MVAKAIIIHFWSDVVSHFYGLASKRHISHCRSIEELGVAIVAPDGCDDDGAGFSWRFYLGGIIRANLEQHVVVGDHAEVMARSHSARIFGSSASPCSERSG
ncbi:uncharacterized protein METZ01_LOCUS113314 [marine metagenome]|uniref:Uncharacterized protein n=1 Tax=marine metagenome TaxID=408172 RepID=A0A381X763_9ZZZZ